jgi:hypothetical protein
MNNMIKGYVPGVDLNVLIFQARKSEMITLIKMKITTKIGFILSA